MKNIFLFAIFRKLRVLFVSLGKSRFLYVGRNLHLGANVRLWAPNRIKIGDNVYIGKDSHIECDAIIGNNSLLANRVALIGRNDHDYSCLGLPVRFSPWIGDSKHSKNDSNLIEIGSDVWVGYGAIILSGVKIGKGSVIAAGSIVTKDIPNYSVACGVPAKVIKKRFGEEEIILHEKMIDNGKFEYSLKGLKYSIIKPWRNGT